MKRFLLALLALPIVALAEPPPRGEVEKMVAQSEFYMSCGLCQVENGPPAAGLQTLILPKVGVRIISAADYNWIKFAGNDKGASGLFLMSERIIEGCRDWASSRCLAARGKWQRAWPVGECMTPQGVPFTAASARQAAER